VDRWPDLPEGAGIEGYGLDEVGAEKLRCIAERLQCRDLFDLHELLDGRHDDPRAIWELYLRKVANDAPRGRQRTPPGEWAQVFERRMTNYSRLWDGARLGQGLLTGRVRKDQPSPLRRAGLFRHLNDERRVDAVEALIPLAQAAGLPIPRRALVTPGRGARSLVM